MANSPSALFTKPGADVLYLVEHFYDHWNTTFERDFVSRRRGKPFAFDSELIGVRLLTSIAVLMLTLDITARKAQKAALSREPKCYI